MSCVRQSPILSRGRVGMTIPMEKSVTFARGALSKCLVTPSSLNGRISNRNVSRREAGEVRGRSGGWPDARITNHGQQDGRREPRRYRYSLIGYREKGVRDDRI